jgi:hypothetical protein
MSAMFEQNPRRSAVALLDRSNHSVREVPTKRVNVGPFFDEKANRIFIAGVDGGWKLQVSRTVF